MQTYTGTRATIKIFDNNDTNYLNSFNNDTLKVLADISFVSAPINGGTEILNASITNAKIVDGTITSAKLAAQASVTTFTNDTYVKGRNAAGSADINMIKINTSDNLQHGAYWEELRVNNNKKIGARTVGAADADWMKENTSDQWEYLATAYTQNLLPKTTNTYDVGGTSNVVNKLYTKNVRLTDSSSSTDFFTSGTWTPTMVGHTTAGTTGYSVQTGNYYRLGNVWILTGRVSWVSSSGGAGGMDVGGLPVTSNTTGIQSGLYWAGGSNFGVGQVTPADTRLQTGLTLAATGTIDISAVLITV